MGRGSGVGAREVSEGTAEVGAMNGLMNPAAIDSSGLSRSHNEGRLCKSKSGLSASD